MDVSRILDSLNNAQREAVSCDKKSLLVLAGAGSGKTRVLVHRIAWLLQVQGASAASPPSPQGRDGPGRLHLTIGAALRATHHVYPGQGRGLPLAGPSPGPPHLRPALVALPPHAHP